MRALRKVCDFTDTRNIKNIESSITIVLLLFNISENLFFSIFINTSLNLNNKK